MNNAVQLANLICNGVKENFAEVYLTGNLRNTTKVIQNSKNGAIVNIPADRYSMEYWNAYRVVYYINDGSSYAQEVDKTGGFSGKHKNYVEIAVIDGIRQWARKNGYKIRLVYR